MRHALRVHGRDHDRLKRSQVAWAKRAGYAEIRTANDEANVAMRGINARLGYEPEPASLLLPGPPA